VTVSISVAVNFYSFHKIHVISKYHYTIYYTRLSL